MFDQIYHIIKIIKIIKIFQYNYQPNYVNYDGQAHAYDNQAHSGFIGQVRCSSIFF